MDELVDPVVFVVDKPVNLLATIHKFTDTYNVDKGMDEITGGGEMNS